MTLARDARRLRMVALLLGAVVAIQAHALGAAAFGPRASTWGGARVDAFVRGVDGALWHRWRDGAGWHWESLGGTPTSDASAVSWSSGRIDVFVRGFGGTLWHRWLSGTTWYGWESLGGQLASEPAAISLAAGTLDVFVQGTDQALWRASYDASGWQWRSLGGRLASAPAVTSAGAGRADVFVQGTDLALWHSTVTGATFRWEGLGGRLGSAPSAVSTGPGLLDVFVRGLDAALWLDHFAGGWQWRAAGGRLNGRPTAAWSGSGGPDGFVTGLDSNLWHWINGAWENLGGPLAFTAGVVSGAPASLDVFGQSTGNRLLHRAWAGTWSAWDDAGGVLLTPNDPITLPVPLYRQEMALDCETATLQMALAAYGHFYTQQDLFSLENPDTRPPVMGPNKHVLQWGDPYTNFVGNVNGSDAVPTGYGIYYPVIASMARSHGDPYAGGGEGYAPGTIYEAVAAGHPVQVWVETGWGRTWLSTWTAWDGRPVRYSLAEHSVVITGVSPGAVRVNDPWRNTISWVSKSTFEISFADFNNMAIIY